MAETITSAQNPKVRKLLALQQKAAERRESGLFVLEGVRELQHCLSAGYKADSLFVCPEILGSRPDAEGLMSSVPSGRVFEVPRKIPWCWSPRAWKSLATSGQCSGAATPPGPMR